MSNENQVAAKRTVRNKKHVSQCVVFYIREEGQSFCSGQCGQSGFWALQMARP